MKLLYSFCFLFFGFIADGQNLLKGVVLDAVNKKPVSNAAVFINTTSIATKTDDHGDFVLKVPGGRSILVFAADGFETNSSIVDTKQLPDTVIVNLQTKSKPLQKHAFEKKGWENWGEFFAINFIGSSVNAKECKIKNPKAVHFYVSGEGNELTALSDEPLIIENKPLGYTITYYLESFLFNSKTFLFSYRGYSFFTPMTGNTTKQQTWEKNRSDAYFGSLMHFMRSVYRNRIAEEGFDVRRLKKIRSIDSYPSSKSGSANSTRDTISDENDDYKDQILNENNYRDIIGASLPGDSIAYAVSTSTVGFDFTNFLLVTYREKEAPPEYQQQISGTGRTSELILINKRPVEIESNGSYFDTGDLLILGYWTWSEKIANMLPLDYNPPKH